MTETLTEYNRKRNFEKTLEPEGGTEATEEALRFVVQHHLARRDHYDFRLEWGGVLLSWAVPKGPSYDTAEKRLAIKVEDHPLEYRNFEGTIPKGEYGGGTVMIWDEGYFKPYGNVAEGLRQGVLKFTLSGKRLRGKWSLVQLKGKDSDTKDNWLLLKEKDEYAQENDGISEYNTSIRSGRTMTEIEERIEKKLARNPFRSADAQLAKLVDSIPSGDDWLFELKYDGYRILAFIENNGVRLISRNGKEFTKHFKDITPSLIGVANGRAMVLDGEMAVIDQSGRTNFQTLQNYIKNPKDKNLTYFVFDLLALDGEDLRGLPLIERKDRLENLMKDAPFDIHYSRHVKGKGKESFAAACQAGMEGIIGKRADSLYKGTRNADWIKLKCDNRQEFVIGGYTLSDKKTSGVSSLILGVYEEGQLVYSGRAGTGLSESDMRELEQKFEKIIRKDSPFQIQPKGRTNEQIIWLEPLYIAEIKFAEWTADNQLRQASFKGLRTDKNPKEIIRERALDKIEQAVAEKEKERPMDKNSDNIKGIRITNPDKIIFETPKVTKADVIRYYDKVSERILPYISGRILSIVRCPKGVNEACFFKKHPGPGSKGIVTVPVPTNSGEREEYFYIVNATGLISEAQMGTIEFHIWGSRADELEKPDMMVFDLDPDEGMDLNKVRQGVKDLRSILSELSLTSYLKTSGGKGYHVVVPFMPAASWDAFHDFARRVAEVMEHKWPDRYTSNVRKAVRADKIFIDWIRNARSATSIAPYSLRARKGATVSMPISWEELNTVTPDGINMEQALLRLESADPWQDFFLNTQQLK